MKLLLLLLSCLVVPSTAWAQVSDPAANTDSRGESFWIFDLPTSSRDVGGPELPNVCRIACAKHRGCRSYTYVKPGVQGPAARCFLSRANNRSRPADCCSSGYRTGDDPFVLVHPPDRQPQQFKDQEGLNRFGANFNGRDLDSRMTSAQQTASCRDWCRRERRCRSYTVTRPPDAAPHCFLKTEQPPGTPCPHCTSGVKIGATDARIADFARIRPFLALDYTRPLLVVLLNFTGPPIVDSFVAAQNNAYYRQLVFGPREPNVASYFYEASKGMFAFASAGVVGPFTVPVTNSTSNNAKQTAAKQQAAANGVNFRSFDRNGDGTVSRDELTILVIDNGSYGLAQTNPEHCANAGDINVCAGVSLLGLNSSFENIAHELAHTIEQDDVYGSTGLGCLAKGLALASCTASGGGTAGRNPFVSAFPDPWHRMRWQWTAPLVVSTADFGSCARLDDIQTGRGRTLLFYDPARGTNEFYMAEFRNSASRSFGQTSWFDASGATNLGQFSSYDTSFPGAGVLTWWVQLRDGRPFNIPSGINTSNDGILQSAAARAGDDVVATVGAATAPNWVLPGQDGILQTPVNALDARSQDMTVFATWDPRNNRANRWPPLPLLNNAQSPPIRWFDGTVSGVRLATVPIVGSPGAAEVEWGTIRMRIDLAAPLEIPRSATTISVNGLFGVNVAAAGRRGVLRARSGGTQIRLTTVQWSCEQVTFTRPITLTAGDYELYIVDAQGGESNHVLARVLNR